VSRHHAPTRAAQLAALFAAPLIHDIAARLELQRRGRHPIALHLAWGALARLYRSANRLDAELAHPGAWAELVARYNAGAAAHPDGRVVPDHVPRLTADTYRHFRDYLCDHPDRLALLGEVFTEQSVALARALGLLDPDGPGSLTRPHPSRTIYGDGTVVRPIYSNSPTGTRVDPDAEAHRRHDGTVIGNNFLTIAVRGPQRHQRVILAVGRAPRPGGEAAAAIELVRRVHAYAGAGIQALVYDGALRGTHHHTLMSELGILVINKVHPASTSGDRRAWKPHTLGTWTHPVGRRGSCTHTLVAHNGAVHDATIDDHGRLTLSDPLPPKQVRRYPPRRRHGWRFSLGVTVPCPYGTWTAWISPHPAPGDPTHGRPDQLRLLPEHDRHFAPLYGLRNDSEAINAAYKHTLIAGRAPARGWPRQLLDLTSWAVLTNSLAWSTRTTS